MSCEDIPSLLDLQKTKKHIDDFGRLMGTGTGTSTNGVTGQIRPTYNKVIEDLGFKPGSGDFTTGFTVMPGERDIAWYNPVDKNWYSYLGVIQSGGYNVLPGTNPIGSSLWAPRTDAILRQELLAGALTIRNDQFALRDVYSVRDYDVLGDGVTDETAKFQASIDAVYAAGGGTLEIPAFMHIKCSTRLFGRKGVSIKCSPTSYLDFRGAPWLTPTSNLALLGYYGTAGAFIYPTADMVEGTNKFNVADTSLFKVGDMIECSMDSNGKWEDTSTVVTSGQLAVVIGVYPATNNIVISEPFYETLTIAQSARVRIIDPIENVTVDGLTILGNGRNPAGNAEQGLKIFFGRNCHIVNCYLKDVDTQSIGMVSCYGGSIVGNRCDDAPLGTIDVVSYGITYSSSMHLEIHSNHGINSRHGIISSHLARSYGYYGINRFINIHDNTHTSNYGDLNSAGFPRAHGGIATHTDAEFINIHDNTVVGCRYGINVRTANNSVKNNKIYDCPIGVYLTEYWADVEISDNEFFDCGRPFATDYAPYELPRGTIDIHDNRTVRCGGSAFTFPTTVKSVLQFNDNNFTNPTNVGATATVSVYNNCDFTADGNDFDVNDTLAIRTEGAGLQTLVNNKIRSLIPYNANSSLYVVSATRFVISGNTITAPVGSTSGGIACPNKAAAPYSVVTGNNYIEV